MCRAMWLSLPFLEILGFQTRENYKKYAQGILDRIKLLVSEASLAAEAPH